MKACEAQILWTSPNCTYRPERRGSVAIRRLGDAEPEWSKHQYKGGACYSAVQAATGAEAIARLFIVFNTMVVRDGIEPAIAHNALMQIDEYRDAVSPEIERIVPIVEPA